MPETNTKELLVRNHSIVPLTNSGIKIAEIRTTGEQTKSLYAPGTSQVELTAAEYELLTPEEKAADVIYFLTDVQDVSIWIGTDLEYDDLPPSLKARPDYLFVIREDEVL